MKSQSDLQSITGGPLLPNRASAASAPRSAAAATGQARQMGSLVLHLAREKRSAFLQESVALTKSTDAYLQLLDSLATEPDVSEKTATWPAAEPAKRLRDPSPLGKRLETQNKSLRKVVAEQQGHIDTLKELVLGSQRFLDESVSQSPRAPVSYCPSTGHAIGRQRAAAKRRPASAAPQSGRASQEATPVLQGSPRHVCRGRVGSPPPRPCSGRRSASSSPKAQVLPEGL